MNMSLWNEVRLTVRNPWPLYVNYGKDPIRWKGECGPRDGAKLTGDRLVQENSALEGKGLASWKGGIIEEKLFTPHFMRDDAIPHSNSRPSTILDFSVFSLQSLSCSAA